MKKPSPVSHANIPPKQRKPLKRQTTTSSPYPFSAIVAQDEMKMALLLNVIDPKVGGVLIMGHRGTGKSTAVRALADMLPAISVVPGCAYRCDPADEQKCCDECGEAINAATKLGREKLPVRVVELPLGATEDRVCGTIDIEQALRSGVKRFEPGVLARANRGFLYIDEVNLLDDHLVDLLLDVSSSGINIVEREGVSVRHPSQFVLVGSGNPEEGELRPQLLDRFGLFVEVETEDELERRVEIVERREMFERDREAFRLEFENQQEQLRRKIARAHRNFSAVKVERHLLTDIARLCSELKIDGHRGELTITRAARALAAFEDRKKVVETDVRRVAIMALRHRLRRDALEETASADRIEEAMNKLFAGERGPLAKSGAGNGDDPTSNGSRPQPERRKAATVNTSSAIASPVSSLNQDGDKREHRDTGPAGQVGGDGAPEPLSSDSRGIKRTLGLDNLQRRALGHSSSRPQPSRQSGRNTASYNQRSGRYSRSVNSSKPPRTIALDATLRAAGAVVQKLARPGSDTPGPAHYPRSPIPRDALRFKLFKRKQGRLFIFSIDLSGSMAHNRIASARDLMLDLLRQSYLHRDRVAIVGFRGTTAEVMLPPSKSILRARRVLDALPIGGGTPLSAGVARSLELAKQVGPTAGEMILLVFTDGGANVSLRAEGGGDRTVRQHIIDRELSQFGLELKNTGLTTVLIDTQKGFRSEGETRKIANSLGANFVKL